MAGGNANAYNYPNDPINFADLTGHDGEVLQSFGTALTALAAIAGADFWNPVGWVAAGALAVASSATVLVLTMTFTSSIRTQWEGQILQAKASRGGGKKPKNDVPDYARGAKWDPSQETLHDATGRVIGDNPVGVEGTGPRSDYNRIKKYLGPRRM